MHLTDTEYQSFKIHFHCTACPDEHYRIPIEVEAPTGNTNWTAYMAGDQFHAGVDWVGRQRGELASPAEIAVIGPVEEQAPKRNMKAARLRFPGGQVSQEQRGAKRAIKLDLNTGLLVAMLFLGSIYFYFRSADTANGARHATTPWSDTTISALGTSRR
jgi:hypothetical protein